jgi:conjugative relaxase-like TrwC/TraI family protein
MLTIKAMAGGENYASHHLSNNDYYSVGETITGQWVGRGAELLKLEGAVTMDQFDAIRQGIDPSTGEFLRQRKSADRVTERERNGEMVTETSHARNLYDFTVSAPKAVSVQALEDPRLVGAHKTAVTEMSAEMERLAGARIRKDGAQDTRTTSNLVIARYDHDSSRELDPQLHSHLVAGNLTYDGAEGKWKALASYDIYQQREYLTEVYRNALAREVTSLGYQVEDHIKHGKDNGFGIAGIKEATLEKYSQRSAQRDQAIAEFLQENGRLPSNNEIAILVKDTRPEKLTAITTAEVKASQYARMDPEEARTLKQLHQTALDRGTIREAAVAAPSLAYAREHVFERVSVAKEYEVQTEALRHGRGRVELPELKAALLAEVASGEMLTARREVATKDSYLREQRMVETINERRGEYQPLGRGREFVPADRLNVEQKAAVHAVLESRDLAINLQGAAGTGKTATLQEMHRGLHDARRSVVAVAPTASAVEELQKVGFPQAMTISRLLADPKQQHELKGQVLIVDEAGMVSSKDMSELLRLAKIHDTRVVFSGDTAQIKSVSEGDALRVLERESKLKSVSLLNVQRQKANAEYLAAVETLRVRPSDGFAKLEGMSAIREVDWRLRGREVSNAYREALAVPNVKGEAREVLVITATHNEIKSITLAIRTDRKAAGELTQGELFSNHTALNWTEAQRKQLHKYQPGQVLEFHKAVKGVGKNEALEVVRADKSGITARKENGESVRLTTKQTKAFGVFEKQDIEVAAGDKLLLKANWHGKDFKATNGELVTVARVEQGRIRLEDDRLMPSEYRQFSHGYAVTAHRSQGKTVDFEIIAAERMAQDLFYVSATRAREGLTVVTSDKTTLMESIGVSGDRQSASELAKNAAKQTPAMAFDDHDLFRSYEAHQQQRQAPQQSISQQEIDQTRHVNHHSTGLGIGF